MKRWLRPFAAALFVTSWATAQIGLPAQALIDAAALASPLEVEGGIDAVTVAGAPVRLDVRSGIVSAVSGSVALDEAGIADLARFLAAATGYFTSIEGPIAEFLAQDFAPIVGMGPIDVGVEAFLLTLDVTGFAAPYAVEFGLAFAAVPEAAFPPTRHAIGPADAKFVIREFSDLQCPHCARFAGQTLPAIEANLLVRGDVRFEYHHFVLGGRFANSGLAAEATECVADANGTDGFWAYLKALFERQAAWSALGDPVPYFVRVVGEIGLQDAGVAECMAQRTHLATVEAATAAAGNLGVGGTPTVYVGPYALRDFGNLDAYLGLFDRIDAFAASD